jgi:hypothetical protein
MAASDNLSEGQFGPLYHGTDVEHLDGDTIYPSLQEGNNYEGQTVAFATTSLENARNYGKHVFEVEAPDDATEGWGTEVYSEKGFKVKRKI